MPDPERHPDNPLPSGPLTHWVDTNVMLEVYSHGDLYDAFESYQRGEGALAKVEERRLRIQGSLWMAMALCRVGARSVTYQHENVRNILRMAPPDSERGGWTSTIVWMLGDHGVFDGWERHMTNDGANLTNRERDRHMVAECRSDGLVLVTRDEEVIGEAHAVVVPGFRRRRAADAPASRGKRDSPTDRSCSRRRSPASRTRGSGSVASTARR